MKFAIFALVFVILLAVSIFAQGLDITEIDVNADYDEAYTYRVENRDRVSSGSVSVSNNSKIDIDVLPGSNLTFTVRVENTLKGDSPSIRGTFVRINIEEIDDGSDLEEESLDFALEPGDDYRFDVKFKIPLDVDAGTYNVLMEAEGEGKNGTSFNKELRLKLPVKKQSHDIRITNILLNPGVIECDRKARLTAEITNVGQNAENQMALEFKSAALGISSSDRDIPLESSADATDEEKSYTKTMNMEVPSFFKSGTYPILINLYWKNFVLFDQKTAELVVKDCSSTVKKEPKTEIRQEPEQEEQEPVNPAEQAVEAQRKAAGQATLIKTPIYALIASGIVILTALAGVILYTFSKPIKK